MRRIRIRPPHVLVALLLLSTSASAAVVRLEITSREPFAGEYQFTPAVGPYERITGRLHMEVDPGDPANARVTDLKLAPRNARGRVEFWTDFFLLKPVDPARGNRRIIYGVNNRGNKLMLGAFNNRGGNDPKARRDAGNGFLMRHGYSILWCGWNGDVLPGNDRLLIGLPIATEEGQTITGPIYAEICVDRKVKSQPLYWGNSDPYPAVDTEGAATLTMRRNRQEPAVEVPRDKWLFARDENGAAVSDPKHLYLKDGFRPGWLYELVYTGRDPRVTGLGFVAVRDCVSFFRFANADSAGTGNPLADCVDRAYVFGISQSGRFIHHFLYEGFNTDEQGRMVFDGAMPHVGGGGKGLFNYRFAQTTRHGSQHQDNLYPSDVFPFHSVPQTDPVTGRSADSFQKLRARGHLPKIFFTETSTEYWARAASLLHTDVTGEHDAAIDPNVRLYFIAGAQHGNSSSSARGNYQNDRNTLDHRPVLRALLVALDRWVTSGEAPPPSRYPRIDNETLVDLARWRKQFPQIPGVRLPQTLYTPLRLDCGPRWESHGIADHVPPKVGAPFRTLVPAVDADGNELPGIRLPGVAVPLRTYAGWNLRGNSVGAEGMLARWAGSQWPLPRTKEERLQSGDPRAAVLERYPTREHYLARVARAAVSLQQERFLLAEDVVRILRAASQEGHWEAAGD